MDGHFERNKESAKKLSLRTDALDRLVSHICRRYVGQTFFVRNRGRISFTRFQRDLLSVAEIFKDVKRDSLLICVENSYEYCMLFLAAPKFYKKVYVLNPNLGQEELKKILLLIQPDFIFGSGSLRAFFSEFSNKSTFYEPSDIDFALSKVGQSAPLSKNEYLGSVSFFSSGTTGLPKEIPLTFRNILFNVLQFRERALPLLKPGYISYCFMPQYHAFGTTINFLVMFSCGVTSVLPAPLARRADLIAQFKEFPPNIINGVNTLFLKLLNIEGLDMSQLRVSLSGGMALREETSKMWYDRTKVFILQGYGLTETTVGLTFPTLERSNTDSVGRPFSKTDIQILTEKGISKNPGEIGEIIVKGPQVFSGYPPSSPSEHAQSWYKGYFRTGDLGCFTADGNLQISGRKKDLVIVSGFNVTPVEVENLILAMGKVSEVKVFGIPSKTGEELLCCAYVSNKQVAPEHIVEELKIKLAKYKIPKILFELDQIPVLQNGKINVNLLKELARKKTA